APRLGKLATDAKYRPAKAGARASEALLTACSLTFQPASLTASAGSVPIGVSSPAAMESRRPAQPSRQGLRPGAPDACPDRRIRRPWPEGPKGAQQRRRVLRRHELLQAVTDEENACREPQDEKCRVPCPPPGGSVADIS